MGDIRYSEQDLAEFKALIEKKLATARIDYEELVNTLKYKDDNGTDDTLHSFKMMEEGAATLSREEVGQLENALIRISNKTYGVCRVTGKLIPKERLMAVPHATLSIEAKEAQG
jgi:RNA polymerase-binding transcription factor DksA